MALPLSLVTEEITPRSDRPCYGGRKYNFRIQLEYNQGKIFTALGCKNFTNIHNKFAAIS